MNIPNQERKSMRTLASALAGKVRTAFSAANNSRERSIRAFLCTKPMKPLLSFVTPNALGYIRIGTTFLVVGFSMNASHGLAIAFFLFGVMTDMIDGPLARLTNRVTEDGKTLDAVADKVFILAPLLFIGSEHLRDSTLWMVIFMELLLILVANVVKPYLRQRHDIPLVTGSNGFGQTKMVTQCIALGFLLLGPERPWIRSTSETLIWIAIGFSVASMLRHLARLEHPVEPKKRIITLPNLITLSGILVSPFVVTSLMHHDWDASALLIAWMFLSDVIDGPIARMTNQCTHFGAVLDPTRDWLSRFMMFVWFFFKLPDMTMRTMLIMIGATEIIILIANAYYAQTCRTLSLVTLWGKRRGLVHGISCGTLFVAIAYPDALPATSFPLPIILFLLMFVFSLIALISYVYQGSRMLSRRT